MPDFFYELLEGRDPVALIVIAIALAIAGVLVIAFPAVLRWLAGGALLLTGVAVLAASVARR